MSRPDLVLLGDSILDNAPYTEPEPDTTAHLERLLGDTWRVHLLARDHAMIGDIRRQLGDLTKRPAVAILSIGGNDVVRHVGLLERRGVTAVELLDDIFTIAEGFERRYEEVAQMVADTADRTLICTIYDARLEPPPLARVARVPLAALNDRIIQTAARLGLDVLDLRTVCTDPEDFELQIEPSAQGAEKIATAIAAVLNGDPPLRSGRVFATERGTVASGSPVR